MRATILVFILVSCVGWHAVAAGDDADFQSVMSGKDFPMSVRYGELTGAWRQVQVIARDRGSAAGGMGLLMMLMGMELMRSVTKPVFFTKGETARVAGDVFLVGYAPAPMRFDPEVMRGRQKPPEQEPLQPDSELILSLVGLREVAAILDVRTVEGAKGKSGDAKWAAGSLGELISGKPAPLKRKLKDLDAQWKRFQTDGGSDTSTAFMRAMMAAEMGRKVKSKVMSADVMYTRGEVLKAEGESYLITYRDDPLSFDLIELMKEDAENLHVKDSLTPDTELKLCLLRVGAIGTMDGIQPFDMIRELSGGDTSEESIQQVRAELAKSQKLSRLHKVGTGLLAYVQDGDKTLPPLDDADKTRSVLTPYTGEDVFRDEVAGDFFQMNRSLARKRLADIENPGGVVVLYESKPAHDERGVLYLDGKVERVPESKWPALKKASNIP